MAGKGGKGLLAAKTTAANKDKDKKKPVSRSSRSGLQVRPCSSFVVEFFLRTGVAMLGELAFDLLLWKFEFGCVMIYRCISCHCSGCVRSTVEQWFLVL